MRITDIELYSGDQEVLRFALGPPGPGDEFHVKAVYGLDADELIPKFTGRAANNNNPLYRISMKPREIVMRLTLNPNWSNGETYSDLRDRVYRAIHGSYSGGLDLICKYGPSPIAKITGSITKLEVPLFNEDSELQITLRCEDPMFRSVAPIEYDTSDFYTDGYMPIYDGQSTAPHGVEMQFTFVSGAAFFSLADAPSPDHQWRLYMNQPMDGVNFAIGDTLYILNDETNREIKWTRAGTGDTTSLMDVLVHGSRWPVVFPGITQFYVENLLSSARVDFVKFHSAFWGI